MIDELLKSLSLEGGVLGVTTALFIVLWILKDRQNVRLSIRYRDDIVKAGDDKLKIALECKEALNSINNTLTAFITALGGKNDS